MRLACDPLLGEVDITASAEELSRLAGAAADGEGLLSSTAAEDGGHLHVDYFPGHFYLAEGSLSLVVSSPHGDMPARCAEPATDRPAGPAP